MPFPKGEKAVNTIIWYGVQSLYWGGWAFLFGLNFARPTHPRVARLMLTPQSSTNPQSRHKIRRMVEQRQIVG